MQEVKRILETTLVDDDDLVFVRQRTKQLCDLTGLSSGDQTKLVTAVSEIARNALQYARRARVTFQVTTIADIDYLTVVVKDQGAGIADVEAVLSDKYVSKTGLGKGLSGARRLVDDFDIKSSESGTTVTLGKAVSRPVNDATIARLTRAMGDQTPKSAVEELKTQNTQLSLMLQELQSTRDQLEKANRLKSEFLANVSHEIRTPMNAMIGITNILARTELDPEQKRLLWLLKDSGKALLNIINDVLDLSKIEAGKLQLNFRSFDLLELLGASVAMFSANAQEKRLPMALRISPDLPRFVYGDPDRLRQVLLNLIGNAIKFSDNGEILVSAQLSASPNAPAPTIRFAVTDQGIGIAPDQQEQLFQAFIQLDASAARKHAGTGLGLNICKRLVDLMGGSIGVESDVNKGSTFWFELPLTACEAPANSQSSGTGQWHDFTGFRVLIAEDHPVNRMVASSELQELNIEVDAVCNGAEAVEAANTNHYDAILMDCQMPVMDGYEAAKAVRRHEDGSRRVPIIAMTANAMAGDKEICLAAGMDDYLGKPFEPEELRSVLSRWLKRFKEPENAKPQSEEIVDWTALNKRFGPQKAQLLVDTFLEDTAERGRLMQAFLSEKNSAALSGEAHALRGACGIIYARNLVEAAEDLETAAKDQNWSLCEAKLFRLQELVKQLGLVTTGAGQ